MASNTSKGDDEPKNIKEVLRLPQKERDEWLEACKAELADIKLQNVYKLVPRPKKKVLTSRWVFKTKKTPEGAIIKRKARLVARGFEQRFGIDYTETFASVAKGTTLKLLLAMAAHFDLEIYQMDMITAFLNGDIDCEIFMEQLEGFATDDDSVWLLLRSLYGLKQSPQL